MNKEYRKLSSEDLQGLLQMRSRNRMIKPKKGRGSYSRKQKHKELRAS